MSECAILLSIEFALQYLLDRATDLNKGFLPFSMSEPETTQFFQFDQEGNMYVFAPGAGCTGPTRLVKPGDELIFNSSYNPLDWATDSTIKMEKEDTALPATCPGGVNTSGHEFKVPLPEEELLDLSHKNFLAEGSERCTGSGGNIGTVRGLPS